MTDEERATELLVELKAILANVYLSEPWQAWPHVVITAFLNVAEAIIRRGVRAEPAALPVLLAQIDTMRSRVLASAQQDQARVMSPAPLREH